MSTLMIIII